MYSVTNADEVHAEESWRFFSHVLARPKKMSLPHVPMKQVLRPLGHAASVICEVGAMGKDL